MGMFSKNTTSLGNYNSDAVVAREGYESSFGAALIMIECAINEEKLFAHQIMKDQSEAMAAVKGLAIDESVEVLTEGLSEFGSGLKKMIMAAWEKLKGLFKSFIAKFDSMIMRDTKALFNKHKNEFYKNTGKLKKWKWAAYTGKKFDVVANGVDGAYSKLSTARDSINSDREKIQEDIDSGDFLDTLLSEYLPDGSTTRKEFAKDFHDAFFEQDETFTDEAVSSTIRTEIANTLQSNKAIDTIKKFAGNVDKVYSNMLKAVDKTINDYAKHLAKPENKDSYDKDAAVQFNRSNKSVLDPGGKKKYTITGGTDDNAMPKLGTFRSAITQYQVANNMASSAAIANTKFEIKQARRVFGQIIAMRSSKNEEVLLDAIGESIEYDVDSDFEAFSV